LVYVKYLLSATEIVIEKHQNYIKQTYSNRCNILGANGIQTLSIPIIKLHNQKQLIGLVRINYEENWQKQHWLAFQSAFGKSAFWFHYKDYFEEFYLKNKYEYLFDFNNDLLKLVIKLLKVEKQINFTDSFRPVYNNTLDLRAFFDAKNRCLAEDTDAKKLKKYLQVFTEKFPFQSNLSILDLLMNQGTQSTNILLND